MSDTSYDPYPRRTIDIKPVGMPPQQGDPWGVKGIAPSGGQTEDWTVKSTQPTQQAVPKSDPWYVKAISPLTSYWPTQKRKVGEAEEQMKTGAEQFMGGEKLKGAFNVGVGGLGYLTSPIESGIESIAGKPIEDVTGLPKEYTNFTIGLGLPGIGLAKSPKMLTKFVAPEHLSQEGMDAASLMRSRQGRAARDIMTSEGNLAPYEKAVTSLPETDQWAIAKYIDGSPGASAPATPQLRAFADAFKGEMQKYRQQLEALPAHSQMDFYEEFFPHMWKDPNQALNLAREGKFGGVGKQGSGASTKARSMLTLEDGERAGLEPVTRNPVEVGVRYINSMRKYIAQQEILQAGIDEGKIIYVRPSSVGASGTTAKSTSIPEGYTKLVGRGSDTIKGQAYAPDDWARVYNNFYSRGIEGIGGGEYGDAYQMARRGANAVTQAVLSFSGYHAFTMAEATMSNQMANSIRQLRHGRPGQAAKEFTKAFVSPVTYAARGKKFSDMYLGKNMPVSPQDKEIIDLVTEAGGRMAGMKHAIDYDTSALGDYLTAFRRGRLKMEAAGQWKDIKGSPVGGTVRTAASNIGRIMDTFNKPIFQHYIPNIKAAAAHENLGQWLKLNPNATQAEKLAEARRVVDSVDNRFGEMIQDNIFWNKVMKQSAQLVLLSYSWNVGGARELGGGIRDVARTSIGKGEWTSKADYVTGMAINWAIMNAAYQFMKTGEAPKDVHDLIAGRTGGVDEKTGQPERILPPGQMKDIFGFWHHGGGEVMNKMNPALRLAGQSMSILGGQGGSDWRGLPILSPRDEESSLMAQAPTWLAEYLKFVAGSMTPISMQRRRPEGSYLSVPELAAGARTAPPGVTAPDDTSAMMDRIWGRRWKQKLRADEREEQKYGGPQE